MLSVPNDARPPTAASDVVPDRVPPPGLLRIATTMVPVNDVTVLSNWSCAATTVGGVITAPAVVVAGGWTVKPSFVTGPGVIVNGALVSGAIPGLPTTLARRVYPEPA